MTIVTYVDAASRSHVGLSNLVYACRELGYGDPVVLGDGGDGPANGYGLGGDLGSGGDKAAEATGAAVPLLSGKMSNEWKAWLVRAKAHAAFVASRSPGELIALVDAFDSLVVRGPEALAASFHEVSAREASDRRRAAAATVAAASGGGGGGGGGGDDDDGGGSSAMEALALAAAATVVRPEDVVLVGAERLCDTADCRRLSHLKRRMEDKASAYASARHWDAVALVGGGEGSPKDGRSLLALMDQARCVVKRKDEEKEKERRRRQAGLVLLLACRCCCPTLCPLRAPAIILSPFFSLAALSSPPLSPPRMPEGT